MLNKPEGNQLGSKTITNVIWSYISFFAGKFLMFIVTMILARLLDVDQFGLMGYCLIGIQYLDILSRFGLDTALISRRDQLEESANTIFVLSLITGIFFFGIAWFIAPLLAIFFNSPLLTELFRVLSVVLLIDSVSIVHSALLSRRLYFRKKLIPDLGKSTVKGIVSIGMALSGYGVWALIWGQIAGVAFSAIALWLIIDWKPSFKFNFQIMREVIKFGLNMNILQIIGALRSNVDYIFIGRMLGQSALGIYTIAYRLPELIVRNVNDVVGVVTHPIMSQIQDDEEELFKYFISYLRYISIITFPAGVGLMIITEPLVLIIYTEKWIDAIFPMQAISLALAIQSISYLPGVLYKATNRPSILTRVHLIKLPILIITLLYSTQFGLNSVAIAQIFLACFYVIIDIIVLNHTSNIKLGHVLQAIRPAFIATFMMGCIGMITVSVIQSNNIIELLVAMIVSVVVYVMTLYILDSTIIVEIITMLKSLRKDFIVRSMK